MHLPTFKLANFPTFCLVFLLSPHIMKLIMDCKRVSDALPFKGINIYNSTAYVQNHTLINRGITTLGGSTIPQCIMSNNKYESQERALMGGIYFVASYLTPVLLIYSGFTHSAL